MEATDKQGEQGNGTTNNIGDGATVDGSMTSCTEINYHEDNYYAYFSLFEARKFARWDKVYGTVGFYETKVNTDAGKSTALERMFFTDDALTFYGCGVHGGALCEDVDDEAIKEWKYFSSSSNLDERYILREDKQNGCHGNGVESPAMDSLDFEINDALWLPAETEDEFDDDTMPPETEDEFDDDTMPPPETEDEFDDDVVGDWGYRASSSDIDEAYLCEKDKSSVKCREGIKNVVDGQFRALIAQLLQIENLDVGKDYDKGSWLDLITSLSWEAVELARPDMMKDDLSDPRRYVKVKCLACGSRTDSNVVKGVVCKKTVAHPQTKSRIDKPRVLILEGDLSMEKALLHKIMSCHPDILLVENSVSSLAQALLLESNIALISDIKGPLLERISRCTGARIISSIDHLLTSNLGSCDSFRVEEYFEKHGTYSQDVKKEAKTLMFFDGCPCPLVCTVLLKGADRNQLKKIKHVFQYGVFVAHHLSVEILYLADEGASLSELSPKSPITAALPYINKALFALSDCYVSSSGRHELNQLKTKPCSQSNRETDIASSSHLYADINKCFPLDSFGPELQPLKEDFSRSIVLSLTTRCDWKGTLCERVSYGIDYHGSFDKPFWRFLCDHLLNEDHRCHSCRMPSAAHVHCYTDQKGSLTFFAKEQPDLHLPGKDKGNIWMWHRCLRCLQANGSAPASQLVLMSDAARGLSFRKFLELSFSDHAAAVKVSSCGHSLYRDCLRFYGWGWVFACFRYATINVHSIRFPPAKLEFNYDKLESIQKEATKVANNAEYLLSEDQNALLHRLSEKLRIVDYFSTIANALLSMHSHRRYGHATPMDGSDSSEFSSLLDSTNPLVRTKEEHTTVSFSDDGSLGKVTYTVTSYHAMQFEALRKTCCLSEFDFIRSLSRCKKCSAYGGKNDVLFAKSVDDRLLIKQVTSTELESLIQLAPVYLKYLIESINAGSLTCMEKILGMYQVTSTYEEGTESKMDVIVMENLLFDQRVSRLYDLRGYRRASRYKPFTTGENMIFLDQNLGRTMPISPIYVGKEAKLLLDRAIWNDTAFLASVDVVDYSLLVGVDKERRELVVGVIDFMRRYTRDQKRLSRTNVFPPKVYRQRFMKAINSYFLVP